MNKIYRIVWSVARGAFIVAHELAGAHGKPSSTRKRNAGQEAHAPVFGFSPLAIAVCFAASCAMSGVALAEPAANTLPTGGQIVGGAAAATISTNGNAMTINQAQQHMIANWESFSIGSAASVHFQQPTGGVALNRVTGSAPSEIFGKLTATGSVFLTNPNGVLFGRTAQVDVGALVATTMKISDSDFTAGNLKFSEGNGSIVNLGKLTAEQAGYIALLAPEVRNEGVITASLGQVVLGAAEAVTLSHDASGLQYAVDKGAVQALVDNQGLVQADGGQVLLSARAANTLAAAAINNSGTIEARSLTAKGGKIVLEADTITLKTGTTLDASGATGGGEVLVGGSWQGSGDLHQATTVNLENGAKIEVSATQAGDGGTAVLWSDILKANSRTTVAGEVKAEGAGGGDGGNVETSGHALSIADSASVKTGGGNWLLDPYDFYVSSSGGNITGAALSTALGSGDVTIQTGVGGSNPITCTGATCADTNTGTSGDIFVNDAISWSSANKLTLDAYRYININANITASDANAKLAMYNVRSWGNVGPSIGAFSLASGAKINLQAGQNFDTKVGGDGNLIQWQVINALGSEADATSGTNMTLQGMARTANLATNFVLGADIDATETSGWTSTWSPIGSTTSFSGMFNGLGHTISNLTIANKSGAGLFGSTSGARFENVGLVNVTITGGTAYSIIGALMGSRSAAGQTYISNVYATGSISGGQYVGGLIGSDGSSTNLGISNSYTDIAITGTNSVGGIIGHTGNSPSLTDVHTNGSVLSSGDYIGGVIGYTAGNPMLTRVYNLGQVGVKDPNSIYADPSSGTEYAGGLLGWVSGNAYIDKSYNKGNVYGYWGLGGLLGFANYANITKSYNTGRVSTMTSNGQKAGGLMGVSGSNSAYFRDCYVLGDVYAHQFAGGVIGEVGSGTATISQSYVGSNSVSSPTLVNNSFCGCQTYAYSATAGKQVGGLTLEGMIYNSNIGQISGLYDNSNANAVWSGRIYGVSAANMSGGDLYYFTNIFANSSYRFDFTNTWSQNSSINGGFPYLSSNPPLTFVTITLPSYSMTYGDALPTISSAWSATGGTSYISALNWGTAVGSKPYAGLYAYGSTTNLFDITFASGSAANYSISYSSNSLTVAQKPLTITAPQVTKTYDGTTAATGTSTYSVALASGDSVFTVPTLTYDTRDFGLGNKTVTPSSVVIKDGGTDVTANYDITYTANTTSTINKLTLNVTAPDLTKTYDGTTTATGSATYSSSLGSGSSAFGSGDSITTNPTLAFADKNYGVDDKTVNVSGLVINDGNSGSNYAITYTPNTTSTINKLALTVTAPDLTKTYDGGTTATGSATYSSSLGSGASAFGSGDSVATSPTLAFTDKNYGIDNKTVAASGLVINDSNSGNNYTVSYANNTTSTINKATLSVTGSKVYDGTTNLFGFLTLGGFVGSETVDYSAATASSSHVATANKYVSSITLTDGTNGGLASNYQIPASYGAGTNAVAITAATLTPTLSNVGVTKVYDGDISTAITPTYSFSGFVTGDTAAMLTHTIKAYNDKDVADADKVTVSGLAISGITGSNGSLASDYSLSTTSLDVAATITRKDVSVSSISIADKVYDGTTNASSVQSTVLTGVLAADAANVNTSGTLAAFSGKDVGTYSISVTGLALTGSEANNYNLTGGTTATDSSVAITAKPLSLTASKTYDGTTNLLGFVTLGGFIGSETLNITSATASNAHVAANGSNYISAITLTDGDNGGVTSNYSLPAYSYHATNNSVIINAATLTPTITNTGVTKVYDGSTSSSIAPTYSFSGLVAGDTDATLNDTGRNYNTADVLTANTVTVSGLSISGITGGNGSAASDYVLDTSSKTVAGTITPKTLTISGLTASNKVYDATTDVTISNWGGVTTGVGTETLVLNHGTASFSDKNKANGKTVTAIGYSLADGSNGGIASNYQLSSTSATTTANITAKTITLAGSTGVTKTYDGRTSMAVGTNGYESLVGVESGDTVTISGAAVFSDANQGARTILQNTVGIAGTDAGNYTLNWTNGSGTITPAALTVTANADAKFVTQADVTTYNGVSYSGFVNGESTSALGLGGLSFVRTNAGTDAAGTYSGVIQASGITANNGNYTISYVNGDYTIVPANQLLVRVTNTDTTYGTGPTYSVATAKYLASDNTTIVDLSGSVAQSGSGNSSVVITDGASGTANFTLGPVSPQHSTAGWLKAGNYSIGASGITESSANFSNNLVVVGALAVNQKALTASATGVTKTYDGNTTMTNVSLGLAGLVGSDVVTVTGNGNFADKNAGTGKAYTVSSVTLGNTDAANYYLSGGDSFSGNDGAISKKTVNLSATKVYDGNAALGTGTVTISGLIGSETLGYTAATVNSKNVLDASFIDAITLQDGGNGGLAANYQTSSLSGANSGNNASVSRKALMMTGHSAQDKTFDGATSAVTSLGMLEGLVGSEQLLFSGIGNFSDPNVGTGKTVTIQLALADGANGGLASNYSISDATTTATIRPIPQTVPPPPPSIPTTPEAPPTVPDPTPAPTPPGDPTGGTPSGPTGTPGTPDSPTGGTPSGPTGTPGTPDSPTGGTPSEPTGTPGTPDSPTGGTPSEPTGTPGSPDSPTGGTPSEPTGTPTTEGDPIPVSLNLGAEIPLVSGANGQGESASSGGSVTGSGDGSGFVSVRAFGATTVPVDALFSFTLPKDTFKHADPKATVILEARLSDGSQLPPWLQFDSGTGRFTGRAPQGVQEIEVVVVARDNIGNEATTKVVLRFSSSSEVKK